MSEKLIHKGMIFDLVQKEFKEHNKTFQRDIIHHPGGVGILALKDDKVLLVKQRRQAVDCDTLEIPAGKLEYGEDPKACGIRELNEETGYESDHFSLVTSFYTTPGFCDERIYIFKAEDVRPVQQKLEQDEDENVTHCWVELDQALEMIKNQEIEDAKTMVALQYAALEKRGK